MTRAVIYLLSFVAASMVAMQGAGAVPDCTPNITKFDVCEQAAMIQREVAPALPMKLSSNMTMQHMTAFGPRLSVVVTWHIEKRNVDKALAESRMELADLAAKMDEQTRAMVCGQNVLAAFVRLGGEIEYVYRTLDAHPVHSPVIKTCP